MTFCLTLKRFKQSNKVWKQELAKNGIPGWVKKEFGRKQINLSFHQPVEIRDKRGSKTASVNSRILFSLHYFPQKKQSIGIRTKITNILLIFRGALICWRDDSWECFPFCANFVVEIYAFTGKTPNFITFRIYMTSNMNSQIDLFIRPKNTDLIVI